MIVKVHLTVGTVYTDTSVMVLLKPVLFLVGSEMVEVHKCNTQVKGQLLI